MSKAVMRSLSPQDCKNIANDKQTLILSKTKPKIEPPYKEYFYCINKKPYLVLGDVFRGNWETEYTFLSGWNREKADKIWDIFNGGVMGEYIVDKIDDVYQCNSGYVFEKAMWSREKFFQYLGIPYDTHGGYDKRVYGLHISNVVIYDTPKELGEFCVTGHCFNFKNVKCMENIWGNYIFHYSQNSLCRACKNLDDLGDCRKTSHQLTRPPQSWCYVEEV